MCLSPLGELCKCLGDEMASHPSQEPLLGSLVSYAYHQLGPRGLDNFKVSGDTFQSFCFVYM